MEVPQRYQGGTVDVPWTYRGHAVGCPRYGHSTSTVRPQYLCGIATIPPRYLRAQLIKFHQRAQRYHGDTVEAVAELWESHITEMKTLTFVRN